MKSSWTFKNLTNLSKFHYVLAISSRVRTRSYSSASVSVHQPFDWSIWNCRSTRCFGVFRYVKRELYCLLKITRPLNFLFWSLFVAGLLLKIWQQIILFHGFYMDSWKKLKILPENLMVSLENHLDWPILWKWLFSTVVFWLRNYNHVIFFKRSQD